MSNALTRIDSKAISDAVTPPVGIEEARAALKSAGLENEINLDTYQARKIIGNFAGHDVHGVVMTDSVIYRDVLMRLVKKLEPLLKSKDAKVRIMASKQITEIVKTHARLAETEMQFGEIIALRSQSITVRGRAPNMGQEPRTEINTKATFVMINPQVAKVDGQTSGS